MPDPISVLEQLREHLATAALVRRPADAGALPVCRIPGEHRDGTPEPDEPDDLVVELLSGPRIPARSPFMDACLEERLVDIRVRSQFPWPGELLARQIAVLLVEQRGEFFGTLRIEWCVLFRGDQPTGSDRRFFERTQTYRIAARVKSLAGSPYAP